MTPRQSGWRSARHVAPPPQPRSVEGAPHPGRSGGAAALRSPRAARLAQRVGAGAAAVGVAASTPVGRWSIAFIGVLAYIYAAVTYGFPIAGPAIVIALLGLMFERTRIAMPLFLGIFALFVAWSGAGYLSSFEPTATSDQLVVFCKLFLIMFVMVNVTRDAWRLRTFMIFFLACFAAYPTRGTLVNYFIAGYTLFGRALWNFIYGNSNDLAALTFFPLSMSLALALTEPKGWIKRLAFVGVGVLPLMILLTQSRGALIALVVSGLLFFMTHARGKRVRSLLTAMALAVVVIPFVPKSAWNRFSGMKALTSTTTVAEADPEGSAEARYNIWRVARRIIGEYPVTGIGLGAYPRAHATYALRVGVPTAALGFRDTHSTYLNVAAETGLPGLLLFLTMIVSVTVSCERVRRRAKGTKWAERLMALELGLLAFLLAGVFGSFSKLSFLYIQLTLMWAIADVAGRELDAAAGDGGGRRSRMAPSVPATAGMS